ncbi:MAG: TldD/PmbA family protein [Bacilli bacterium]|nr:TldD/PmbA family protein [Bacilli bacterium]
MTYSEIINKGLSLGISEIELYVVTSKGMNMTLTDGELDSNSFTENFGMSIRGLYNGKMGYVYLESTEDEAVEFALKSLIENASKVTSSTKAFIYDGSGEYQTVEEVVADYENYPVTTKLEKLQELSKKILATNDLIKKVGHCRYGENSSTTRIINSKGLDLKRDFSYAMVMAGALATDGKETSLGYARDLGFEFEKIDYDKIVKESTEETLSKLGAGSLKTGVYKAVFRYDVMTSILQAFSSVFSGEAALKKLTLLTDKIDTQVFGQNINIVDDPFCDKAVIKQPFDDEGVPCYTKNIVENGVFKGFMHNLSSADYFNTKSTGNGFKAGIAGSVNVSPTNLYLQPGEKTLEEVISTMETGVLITDVNGLHAGLNPISGAFNVQASGFEIKDGKIDKPVTLFVVSSNFYELLNNIEEIACDLEDNFMGVAAPSVKIKSVMISGK